MDYSIRLHLPESLQEHLAGVKIEAFIQQIVDEALQQKIPNLLPSENTQEWKDALTFIKNHRSFPLNWEQNKLTREQLNER
ncbi:MAG: hypothetical protein HQM11_15345 [SAR324 cluster bacterium]|nr:hypothetical protein [SAR324 cluster bacterium]